MLFSCTHLQVLEKARTDINWQSNKASVICPVIFYSAATCQAWESPPILGQLPVRSNVLTHSWAQLGVQRTEQLQNDPTHWEAYLLQREKKRGNLGKIKSGSLRILYGRVIGAKPRTNMCLICAYQISGATSNSHGNPTLHCRRTVLCDQEKWE